MRFRTTIELGGKTATGYEVPAEVVESLGKSKKPAVKVTINNHTYRSTVAVYNGKFFLPLAAEHREAAGVAANDEIDVDIELDTEPREVTIPPDFQAALAGDADAQRFFDSLSYSNKRRLVLAMEGAKAADTRQRRIEKTISNLRDGKA